MTSQAVSDQNLTYLKDGVDFEEMEALDIDSALVMPLLEESQGDERDEDRLNSLIRSLEAEIKASSVEDQNFNLETALAISSEGNGQSCNLVGQMENPEWSCTGLEFRWGDHMDAVLSSPSDEPMSSYIEQEYGICEMDGMIIEVGAQNYYSDVYNYEATDQENEFSPLWWQETYYN